MPTFINTTTCEHCGTVMHRHWNANGTESSWLDSNNSLIGDDGSRPSPEVKTLSDYIVWLRNNDIASYSLFCAGGAGILAPWQHRHRAAHVAVVFTADETIPECCGMPAQLVRDGWRCRVTSTDLTVCGSEY